MTDNQPDNAAPDEATGKVEAVSFSVGKALQEARVQHGLSVEEISNRIKFAPRQVEALEADDFAHLPEPAFVRGFVRSYARLLQIDPAPLLGALPHAPEEAIPLEAKALTEVPYPGIYEERKYNIIWLAAALAVAIVLALSAWLLGGKPKEQAVSGAQNAKVETLALPEAVPVSAVPDMEPAAVTPPAEKPVPEKSAPEKPGTELKKPAEVKNAPQVAVPPVQHAQSAVPAVPLAKPVVKPAAPSAASGPAAIRMTFDEDAWAEIRDKDGKILLSQINHAGVEQRINGSAPFSLVIGHAKAVHLYYKGQAVDLAPHTKVEVARLTLE